MEGILAFQGVAEVVHSVKVTCRGAMRGSRSAKKEPSVCSEKVTAYEKMSMGLWAVTENNEPEYGEQWSGRGSAQNCGRKIKSSRDSVEF